MDKIPFEDGTLVKKGYVTIDGKEYEVEPAEYTGKTPLSAYNINKMQDNIEEAIDEGDLVKRLNIEGNSKQDKREGKNRFNINGTISNGSSSQISQNGFTLTKDSNNRVFGVKFDTIPAGTYTFSCDVVSNTTENATSVAIRSNTTNEVIITISAGKTGKITQKLTLTSGTTNALYAYISANDTDGVSIELENIQIEQGSEATEYEPYGASPSIDYPSEVKSVGDNINLFDKNNAEILHVWLNRTGTTISTISNNDTSIIVPVKPNETYTVSKKASGTTAKNRLVLGTTTKYPTYSTELNVVNGFAEGTTETKLSIKTGENDKYLIAYIYSKDTLTTEQEMLGSIKLEQGSIATPYSPYGQGSIEIKQVNKNFFDGIAEQGALNADGWTVDLTTRVRMNKRVLLKKGSYTINANGSEQVAVYFYNDTTTKAESNSGWVNTPYTFTITTDKYVCGAFRKADSSAVTINNINNIQIEKGSTATEYVEHQSQIKALYTQQPFRAIGDVKDRFVKKDGVWYEEHNVSEFSLSKITDWVKSSSYSDDTYFCGYSKGGITTFIDGTEMMCDKLQIGLYSNVTDKECINNAHQFQIRILASRLSENSTTGLSNYLAENPIYVYCVTIIPELMECTPEQVEALNDIYSAYGEGLTNITCTDEVEPVIEIIKETKEIVQSNNDKAISALLERVSQLESVISSMQSTTAEGGA